MKKDYLVMSILLFGMAYFCYRFNGNVVAPSSSKDILEGCTYVAGMLGIVAVGFSLGVKDD